jgi:TonB family protein
MGWRMASDRGKSEFGEVSNWWYIFEMRTCFFFLALLALGGCAASTPMNEPTPFHGYLPQLPPDAKPPEILRAVKPIYPEAALFRGIQGCARVKFDISSQGLPVNIVTVSSVPVANFGPAAMATLRKWRFVPAKENGHPVVVKGAIQKFGFNLGAGAQAAYGVKVQPLPSSC